MKIIVVLILILLGNIAMLSAQDTVSRKMYFSVNAGYSRGVGSIRFYDNLSLKNTGTLYRLRISAGKVFTNKFMAGIGVGAEAYHRPDYNFLPVIAEARYFTNEKLNRPFIGISAGYSIKLSQSFKAGFHSGMNIGYQFGKSRKNPILLSAGLELHQVKNTSTYIFNAQTQRYDYIQADLWLKSFSVNAALLF